MVQVLLPSGGFKPAYGLRKSSVPRDKVLVSPIQLSHKKGVHWVIGYMYFIFSGFLRIRNEGSQNSTRISPKLSVVTQERRALSIGFLGIRNVGCRNLPISDLMALVTFRGLYTQDLLYIQ